MTGIGPPNAVEGQSWVVARVDSIQLQTFDQLRAQLEQTVPDADQSAVQRALGVLLRRADVTVASKYGSWDAKAGTVVPPVGATATTAPLTGAEGEQPVPAESG